MNPISKEEFSQILQRQQQSGLSIKDFCSNETYTVSSFHYWKSKFGFTQPYNNHPWEDSPQKLAPININLPAKKSEQPPLRQDTSKGEIRIKFPGGIQVSFIGSAQSEVAAHLLNQICSAYVLSE